MFFTFKPITLLLIVVVSSLSPTIDAFTVPKASLGVGGPHHGVVSSSSTFEHSGFVSHSSPKLVRKQRSEQDLFTTTSTLLRESEVSEDVLVEKIDNGRSDIIAPSIYAVFTAMLIYIIYQLRDGLLFTTFGSKALSFVTGALIWDNLIISIGSFFFKNAENNKLKYKILKLLSYPRFTLHALGTPLQCITVAEMGKAAGVGFLQSKMVQTGVILASFAVAVYDRFQFGKSEGIVLDKFEDSPPTALERDLVKFTYKEPKFTYVIPAIVLALFNLVTGIAAMKTGLMPSLSKWMFFAAMSALVGNALPGPIMAFSGNLGEAGMQFGLLNAARIAYGTAFL